MFYRFKKEIYPENSVQVVAENSSVYGGYQERQYSAEAFYEWMNTRKNKLQYTSCLLYTSGLSGTLKVGYLELFTQNILPVAIRSFHEKFPMVDMQLRETRLQEANQKVLDGELDVGFVITHDMLERKPELEYRHIYAGQVELIVSNQHPLAAYQMRCV